MRFPLVFACAACLASCLENRYPTDDPPAVVPADPIAASAGPDFGGCWRAQFEGDSARIRAWQKGKALGGYIVWDAGGTDTLGGSLGFPYLRIEARGPRGNRVYLGNVLRTVMHFETKLLDTPNRVVLKLTGDRVPCGTDTLAAP